MLNSICGRPLQNRHARHTYSYPNILHLKGQTIPGGWGRAGTICDTNSFKYSLFSSNVAGTKCLSVHRKFSGVGTAILGLMEGQQNTRQALVFQGSCKDAKPDRTF